MMNGKTLTVILSVAIFLSFIILVPLISEFRLPGIDQGYEPKQPIAFSHRLHAGELEMSCLYCHSGAEKSRIAGVPPLSLCMNCHQSVSAPLSSVRAEEKAAKAENRNRKPVVSSEIEKIYQSLALDKNLKPDPKRTPAPIEWKRVHNLADFVYFDHRPHVSAGVDCRTCHGPVESMERVRQFSNLTMGWCVSCHRGERGNQVSAARVKQVSTDCSACHY